MGGGWGGRGRCTLDAGVIKLMNGMKLLWRGLGVVMGVVRRHGREWLSGVATPTCSPLSHPPLPLDPALLIPLISRNVNIPAVETDRY